MVRTTHTTSHHEQTGKSRCKHPTLQTDTHWPHSPTQRPKQILYINSARQNVHNKLHILRAAMQNNQAAKHPTLTNSVEPFSNQHAGGQTNVSSRSLFIHKQQRDTDASQSDCKIREHTYERQVDATEYYTYQWQYMQAISIWGSNNPGHQIMAGCAAPKSRKHCYLFCLLPSSFLLTH